MNDRRRSRRKRLEIKMLRDIYGDIMREKEEMRRDRKMTRKWREWQRQVEKEMEIYVHEGKERGNRMREG